MIENSTDLTFFTNQENQTLLDRFKTTLSDTLLKDWNISINYGIKTGFNEAFIIDVKKKEELIAKDPNSAKIIKPIIRGRDIKRYQASFADLWLIDTHNGYNNELPIQIENYPVVKEYLDTHLDRITKRQDKGVTPYNLRHCAYHQDFEKEKIVYAEIVFDSAFYFDNSNMYAEATAFVLTGENTKYLTALLNSRLLTFSFRAFYAGGDLRGKLFDIKRFFLRICQLSEMFHMTINIVLSYWLIMFSMQN